MRSDATIGAGLTRPDHPSRPTPRVRVFGSDEPILVLVHGVGVGSEAFGRLAHRLAQSATVVVVDRAGYGRSTDLAPAWTIADHVDDLVGVVAALPTPPLVVGVSGGATIALAMALTAPDGARGFIVHEPLVGPLAPGLHRVVSARLTQLEATPGPVGAADFVHALIGNETWELLGERRRREVGERAPTIRFEAPSFARFSPSLEDLAAHAARITTTMGESSPPVRAEVADTLGGVGIRTALAPGGRHLPQVEAPESYARLIADLGEEMTT